METGKATSTSDREALLRTLRGEILSMQGFITPSPKTIEVPIGTLATAFPHGCFPVAAVHEFTTYTVEEAAATSAFVAALTATLTATGGACIWVQQVKRVFPPALACFGLGAEQVVFVGTRTKNDALWVAEESLKAPGVRAVVAEIPDLDLTASRRLQLAVEKGRTTGLILRHSPRLLGITCAAARWQVAPVPSRLPRIGMPGLGHPAWHVALTRVKNGRSTSAVIEWSGGQLRDQVTLQPAIRPAYDHRKAV